MARNIVIGAKVKPEKVARARDLRENMTRGERELWKCLRANGLDGFHFRRQQVIEGLIVDFYCHSAGLVVEVDGEIHNMQKDYDQARSQILINRGLKVLRVKEDDVILNLASVLEQIRSALKKTVS